MIKVHINMGGYCSRCGTSVTARAIGTGSKSEAWAEGEWIALKRSATTFVAYAIPSKSITQEAEILCKTRDTKTVNLLIELQERVRELRPQNERATDKTLDPLQELIRQL